MDPGHVIDRIRNPNPARQYSYVSDEGNIRHQALAFAPWIAAEHPKLSLIGDQSKNRVQGSGLASPIGPNQAEDAPLIHPQIDAVERDRRAEHLAEIPCFDTRHDQRSSSSLSFASDVSFGDWLGVFPLAPAFSNS